MGKRSRDNALNDKLDTTHDRPVDNSGNLLDPEVADTAPYTESTYPAATESLEETAADATVNDSDDKTEENLENLSVEELREQIEQTRASMTETVDELADRLNPEALKAQVHEATIGKVQEVAATAKEKAHDLAIIAKDKAQVLAGVAGEKAHELKEVAEEKIQEAKARAAERAEQAALQAENTSSEWSEAAGATGAFDAGSDDAGERSPLQRAARWVRRNPVPFALGVVTLVGLIVLRRRGGHEETYIVEIID